MSRVRLVHATVAVWACAFAVSVALDGIPTNRVPLATWIVTGVIAVGAGSPRRTARSILLDWLPVFAALAAYDLLRGWSDGNAALAHSWPHLDIDQAIGGGTTPSEHLQEAFHVPGTVRWWDYGLWAIYVSHFIAPFAVAVALWARRSARFRPYLYGFVLLSFMGVATYAAWPAKPPWMLAQEGATGPLVRIVQTMWGAVGVDTATRIWSTDIEASRYSNLVAALPSLHAAFPALIACALWSRRRGFNALLLAYPLLMGLGLVYGGEHFTFDIVLGWAYAVVAWVVASRVIARVRRRRSTPAASQRRLYRDRPARLRAARPRRPRFGPGRSVDSALPAPKPDHSEPLRDPPVAPLGTMHEETDTPSPEGALQ